MAALVCPKCQSEMRTYERSGITIDQCEQCRGIFLDRGEMERLVDAEGRYAAAPPPQPAGAPQGGGYPPGYEQRPRGGLLQELFGEHNQPRGYGQRRGGHH